MSTEDTQEELTEERLEESTRDVDLPPPRAPTRGRPYNRKRLSRKSLSIPQRTFARSWSRRVLPLPN